MGRRSGPGVYIDPSNRYRGNQYYGEDDPGGFDHGDIFRFQLRVVDVCNGEKVIYVSKTKTVSF
jgi:hypothetical protein